VHEEQPVGVDLDPRLLVRTDAGKLDERRDPDPDQLPGGAPLLLLGHELAVRRPFQQRLEERRKVPALVDQRRRPRAEIEEMGDRVRRHEVPAAELDRIEVECPRDAVEHHLTDVRRLGRARPAHRPDRRPVGENARRLDREGLPRVGPGEVHRGKERRQDSLRADVRALVAPRTITEGEQLSVGARGDLELVNLLPCVVRRDEVLGAVFDPLDRAAEVTGCEGHEQIFRIELAAHAERAADRKLDQADLLGRKAQHLREDDEVEVLHLRRAPHGQAFGQRVVFRQQSTRLQRHARVPVHAQRCANDDVCTLECLVDVPVLDRDRVDDVASERVVQDLVGSARGGESEHRRALGELDADELRRVLGGVRILGENDRDGLPDEADPVRGEWRLKREVALRRLGERQPDRDAQLGKIRSGQDADDARMSERGCGVDRHDVGVRDRAPDDAGPELVVAVDVCDEARRACKELSILAPRLLRPDCRPCRHRVSPTARTRARLTRTVTSSRRKLSSAWLSLVGSQSAAETRAASSTAAGSKPAPSRTASADRARRGVPPTLPSAMRAVRRSRSTTAHADAKA
jgi:hypothetical protein